MPMSPMMIGTLRLFTGLNPAAISRSVVQPKPTLPITPNTKGMAAMNPVERMLICRWISR